MTSFSGKYGSVQRVLPRRSPINGTVWGDIMEVDPSTGEITPIEAVTGSMISPERYVNRARPTVDGYQPLVPGADYSNTVSTVQDWSMDNGVETMSYVASNTNTFNAKHAGKRSSTGKFGGIGAFPPLNPGDRFLFRGFVGPDNRAYRNFDGTFNYAGYVYQIAAMVTSISVSINYGSFAPIRWDVNWQSDWQAPGDQLLAFGIPSDSVGRGFYDETNVPCGEDIPSTTCMLRIGKTRNTALTGAAARICLESTNLTFNSASTPVTNSCSARSGGWQTSMPGSTDVTLAATIHAHYYNVFNRVTDNVGIKARSEAHYPGIDRYVRLYVGSSDECVNNGAWEFNKLFIGGFTGMNVDIGGGGLVSFSTNMEFNAFPKKYYKNANDPEPDNPLVSSDTTPDTDTGCDKGYIKYRLPDPTRHTRIITPEDKSLDEWVSFVDLANRAVNPHLPLQP